MGQILPFPRTASSGFTEPQLSALWAVVTAARQAELILIEGGASVDACKAARAVGDQSHALFKSAFDRSCRP